MISLDWKERLIKDTDDFIQNKLPNKDYHIGIIYNSYPVRAGHNIPHEVLSLVAKEISTKIAKEHSEHIDFYDYLWYSGGDNGKFITSTIIAKFIKKDNDLYFEKMTEYLNSSTDASDISTLLDRVFLPILKKNPDKYLHHVYSWLNSNKLTLEQVSIKLLIKMCKANKEYAKPVLKHLENKWMYASAEMIKIYSQFVKELGKFDQELFVETFEYYANSHDPNVVEILTGGTSFCNERIYEIVEEWTKSGNARLKKSALNCRKLLKRKMKRK